MKRQTWGVELTPKSTTPADPRDTRSERRSRSTAPEVDKPFRPEARASFATRPSHEQCARPRPGWANLSPSSAVKLPPGQDVRSGQREKMAFQTFFGWAGSTFGSCQETAPALTGGSGGSWHLAGLTRVLRSRLGQVLGHGMCHARFRCEWERKSSNGK